MADISKLTLPNGTTYDIKDAVARAAISKHTTYQVVAELPQASAETLDSIYLVRNQNDSEQTIYDYYLEYITLRGGTSPNYTYAWELIGTTNIDLSDYSHFGHTHTVTTNVSVDDISYKPVGTVSTPTITSVVKNTNGDIITPYSMSSDGSYTASSYTPESYTVNDEILIINSSSYTKESITLPSRTQMVIAATSDQPTFTGTTATFKHTVNNPQVISGQSSK